MMISSPNHKIMFKNYIHSDELFLFFPRLREWIKLEDVQTVINSASLAVADDIRRSGTDLNRIYVPTYLDDRAVSRTDYTSEPVDVGSATRIVIDINSVTDATYTIQGSDDGIHWQTCNGLDGSPSTLALNIVSRYTMRLSDVYKYIRYKIDGSATHDIYAVDTAYDIAIMYKTIQAICLPILGTSDDAQAMYAQCTQLYDIAIARNKYDYDRDGSNTIDPTERNVNNMVRIIR